MSKNVLITGGNGFMGQHLCVYLIAHGYNVLATGRGVSRIPFQFGVKYIPADLTDKTAILQISTTFQPDFIVHTAAMSKPDECHNNRSACLLQNVEATANLLQTFPKAHFIYVSTDFVFGENGPHSETDATGPLNFYGESKLMAEQLVPNSGVVHTIMRPVFMYGKVWDGLRPSFLHWVKHNLEQQKPIKVVSDQLRTPTFIDDISAGVEAIIQQEQQGIYHLAGKDIVSPYQMAITTAQVLDLDVSLIQQVTADTFPEPVKRAKKSGLKIDKAIADLGYQPHSFEEGVQLTFGL
jgi:dTDP-4-dehydrorhamnose reductase